MDIAYDDQLDVFFAPPPSSPTLERTGNYRELMAERVRKLWEIYDCDDEVDK
jgi:hypothetical protein